ncbi:unnamed protein product [Rotaria magnacalcarata]|uniref:G-protein coupled receptors family 1 profile domain-containing protein n=1 Tax=Rotaria magnacalcarata TaxID=392030 RepID=A0A816MZA7_9BILA|nr:unnamed protein product [Rotaria magnacalcarata]
MPDVQLLVIIQYINIYIGLFAASIGTIGNILNIITFTCLKKYRIIPSSIFLAGASLAEQLTIIGLLFPQSIDYATGHDPRVMSSLFCKISSVLYTGGGVFALVCLYLAAIDRDLQTCRSAVKRQWMKMKSQHYKDTSLLKFVTLIYCCMLIFINNLPISVLLKSDYKENHFSAVITVDLAKNFLFRVSATHLKSNEKGILRVSYICQKIVYNSTNFKFGGAGFLWTTKCICIRMSILS